MFKVIIEMPKGDDRRRHLGYDKSGFVDIGPIKDVIQVNNGIMPVDYGYVPNTFNANDKDEVDVLLISNKKYSVGGEVVVEPIGLLRREDGDDKMIVVDVGDPRKSCVELPDEVRKSITEFFGYKHKIISIEGAEVAIKYLEDNKIQ